MLRTKKGFSFIEIIFAMTIISICLTVLYKSNFYVLRSSQSPILLFQANQLGSILSNRIMAMSQCSPSASCPSLSQGQTPVDVCQLVTSGQQSFSNNVLASLYPSISDQSFFTNPGYSSFSYNISSQDIALTTTTSPFGKQTTVKIVTVTIAHPAETRTVSVKLLRETTA